MVVGTIDRLQVKINFKHNEMGGQRGYLYRMHGFTFSPRIGYSIVCDVRDSAFEWCRGVGVLRGPVNSVSE